jgi:hypothetical protein
MHCLAKFFLLIGHRKTRIGVSSLYDVVASTLFTVLYCTENDILLVRFEILTAASMKMAVFWVVAPCSLVQVTDVSEVLAASRLHSAITQKTAILIFLFMAQSSNTEIS